MLTEGCVFVTSCPYISLKIWNNRDTNRTMIIDFFLFALHGIDVNVCSVAIGWRKILHISIDCQTFDGPVYLAKKVMSIASQEAAI